MTIKALMLPHVSHYRSEQSGIRRVVEAYFRYLPDYDIELVHPDSGDYDIRVAHAGMGDGSSDVAHLHGLYWSADYDCSQWEYESNARIISEIRQAKQITVPSNWVAEVFRRDMRFNPHVIGHGIEWDDWQHNEDNEGYILAYGKNRAGFDVCDPAFVTELAYQFPGLNFVCTFAPNSSPANVYKTGVIPHLKMRKLIQRAAVVMSPIKETWGVMTVEAMAAGRPILGANKGGNTDLIQHGVNGYLYNDFRDMADGLDYCLKHQQVLGENGKELAKLFTWQKACEQVADVYRLATKEAPAMVGVVIPVYKKTGEELRRAIDSCLAQTLQPSKIMVIDDGSNQDYTALVLSYPEIPEVGLIKQSNQGVANARNNGIVHCETKYICCLDADDWLDPAFLETCINALEADRSLGIAYTYLQWHRPDGTIGLGGYDENGRGSPWPHEWNFDKQVYYRNQDNPKGLNQIPTCCVFRREMWQRLGGYRQRYAPAGAGAEDAEFWTRAGSYGWKAQLVTDAPLFHYSTGGNTSDPNYREVDWLAWHPWSVDGQHPFASYATPAGISHRVRQYDEPLISVVIPVGPGHEHEVINALDSLEAQHFRKWEAIVVFDIPPIADYSARAEQLDGFLFRAYPYVKWHFADITKTQGAGFARNRGAEIARAPFLLFLDADDTLRPGNALDKMLDAWNRQQCGIYTDYVGHSIISPEYAKELEQHKRLESYNPKTGEAIIKHQSYDFDLARILRQPDPDGNIYSWQMITCLFPTKWHFDIGGFDEAMATWEDWDYWLRMVKAGYRFWRLPEELLRYRFYTSTRRHLATIESDSGRQMARDMIKYLVDKHSAIEVK